MKHHRKKPHRLRLLLKKERLKLPKSLKLNNNKRLPRRHHSQLHKPRASQSLTLKLLTKPPH